MMARRQTLASLLVFLLLLCGAPLARADALDDAFAKLFADKFPQTEQAIVGIAAAAPPHGAEILDALRDGRLLVNADLKRVVYSTAVGESFDARTGAKVDSVEGFRKVRVNNGVRRALDAAMGALGVGAADPQRRVRSARELFNNPNASALPIVDAQLAKETDAGAKAALGTPSLWDIKVWHWLQSLLTIFPSALTCWPSWQRKQPVE